MNDKEEVRVCKNKDCQKVLPVGYKYKYCEACRNKRTQNVKKKVKGAATVAIGLALGVFAGSWKGTKN